MNYKVLILTMVMGLIALGGVSNASAVLKMDSIQFDPAIVAAGDEVDIIIQYHTTVSIEEEDKVDNANYTYKVTLEPDDDLARDYVTFIDAEGDDLHGRVYSGDYYNKVFRIKVANNAPAGNYEFKLSGRWYYNGEPEPTSNYIKFKMPVKKEGIVLNVASIVTIPSEVRPGDNFVEMKAYVENSGEKDAKAVELRLVLPEGLTSSYTNNNRLWIGRVNAGEQKEATFFIDVDDDIEPQTYDIRYLMQYADIDNNNYQKSETIQFLVKERPYLVITNCSGAGLAGSSGKLRITVKNVGTESAESVDVRLIKQNSQPFSFDVRSDYIGELEPGEEGVAIFDIDIDREAEVKNYSFKLIIRSAGDSDEGDDNIYTYNRRATFKVTGKTPNTLKDAGLALLVLVVIIMIGKAFFGRKGEKR